MKLNPTEQSIYSAVFAQQFFKRHDKGIHNSPFSEKMSSGVEKITLLWEQWCADLAVDDAEDAVRAHREAIKRRRKR